MNDTTYITAAGMIDASGTAFAPAAIRLQDHQILASGTTDDVGPPAPGDTVVPCDDLMLMPALVNAHAHLDLTSLGVRPFHGSFAEWATMVRNERPATGDDIRAAVQDGAARSRDGGTTLVGDIAGNGSLDAASALMGSSLAGVSFVEVFGIGSRRSAAHDIIDRVSRTASSSPNVRIGLQPHAPYSCAVSTYDACRDAGVPLATHLAETLDELAFVAHATGPLADMLRSIRIWDESIVAQHVSPVALLRDVLHSAPFVVAHCNYVADDDLDVLASVDATVAYCPRASAYFEHPHEGRDPHRYLGMLDRGINVALGTDSMICLDTDDRISVLDDMRLLWQRDGTDPVTLLRMATLNGAMALGAESSAWTLQPGPTMGIIGVPAHGATALAMLVETLRRDDAPQWIVEPGDVPWIASA
ncbi:MAG: amidohydrolase family protein [Planctomycetota bacterium]